ncbi:MAG: putative RNase H-like nuclease (RuvC/YqgF family) [Rhodothermales bacterium]|jgi:predicted RNase H-like nuclease (RuvC/YqgF family)
MNPEKLLGRLNRAYLVLVVLVVGMLAARAFQRSSAPAEEHERPSLPDREPAAVNGEQTKALKSKVDELTRERDALRHSVDEKETQNSKLRASMETLIKDTK